MSKRDDDELLKWAKAARAKVLDAKPVLKARAKARVRAVAQAQKDQDAQLFEDVAAPLVAAGFSDNEIMRVLDVVEDIVTRHTRQAIAETMTILDAEGVEGLRRRLVQKKP